MIDALLDYIELLESRFWANVGLPFIVFCGAYLTLKTKGFQFVTLFKVKTFFMDLVADAKTSEHGTNPIKLYFASIGGMVGVGNIVAVVSAVTIGGPGGVFWMWIASFCGMLIKYSEIYLGVTHRVRNNMGGFDGGPMYYLKKAFPSGIPSMIAAFLLSLYSIEIYQFTVVSDTVSYTMNIDKNIVVGVMLVLIFAGALGGISRLANICTAVMPVFILVYLIICITVIYGNFSSFMAIIPEILKSAFTGHAAIGGFAGSTFLFTAQNGIARTVYSGDIGIGYDSIIQSDTKARHPEKQARIAIIALFTDTTICTLSCLVVLVTGFWCYPDMPESEMINKAFATYIPYSEYVVMTLIFIGAISTVTGYMVVGQKCAQYINPRFGRAVFLIAAFSAFIIFAFYEQTKILKLMSVIGGLLMICNLSGIVRLRKDLKF